MKKIIYILSVCFVILINFACTEIDNYAEPKETFKGRFIDKTTGENFICETGNLKVKLEELSWSDTPTPQEIPSKYDGTFQDTRLFAGHYRVTPFAGPFWPVEPIELDIKGVTERNFELTPYLKIKDMSHSLSGNTLTFKCKLEAPIKINLPRIVEIKPFLNVSPYVGNGATINQYSDNKITIEQNWSDEIANTEYTITVPNLLTGRTFYARLGAQVDDSYRGYNYSEIIEIKVP